MRNCRVGDLRGTAGDRPRPLQIIGWGTEVLLSPLNILKRSLQIATVKDREKEKIRQQ